jgi:hypothetical protein
LDLSHAKKSILRHLKTIVYGLPAEAQELKGQLENWFENIVGDTRLGNQCTRETEINDSQRFSRGSPRIRLLYFVNRDSLKRIQYFTSFFVSS